MSDVYTSMIAELEEPTSIELEDTFIGEVETTTEATNVDAGLIEVTTNLYGSLTAVAFDYTDLDDIGD